MLRFSWARDSFQNGGAKHGCVGAHGVGLLFLAAVLGCCSWLAVLVYLCGPFSMPWPLVFCSLSQLQSLKTTLVVSPRRIPCISVGTASLLSFVSASFRNSFKTESSLLNNALLQYRSPTLGSLCLEYLSNHLRIDFWATSTLAATDFSFVPFLRHVSPLGLSSCFSWSRWSICFPCGYVLPVCIIAHASLQPLSKGGCTQCFGALIFRS